MYITTYWAAFAAKNQLSIWCQFTGKFPRICEFMQASIWNLNNEINELHSYHEYVMPCIFVSLYYQVPSSTITSEHWRLQLSSHIIRCFPMRSCWRPSSPRQTLPLSASHGAWPKKPHLSRFTAPHFTSCKISTSLPIKVYDSVSWGVL